MRTNLSWFLSYIESYSFLFHHHHHLPHHTWRWVLFFDLVTTLELQSSVLHLNYLLVFTSVVVRTNPTVSSQQSSLSQAWILRCKTTPDNIVFVLSWSNLNPRNMYSWLPSFPYGPPAEGYWAPVTSTLNWCEEVCISSISKAVKCSCRPGLLCHSLRRWDSQHSNQPSFRIPCLHRHC